MTERRTRGLLAGLLVLQLVLLTIQLPDPTGERSYLEGTLLRVVAPFGSLVAVVGDAADRLAGEIASQRLLAAENRRLREEVQALRREAIRRAGVEDELRRLEAALDYSATVEVPVRVADVVYIDHASWLQTLVLSVPAGAVGVNQPVVSGRGLVGRVVVAAGRYAKVQLITDRAASVGAMIQRTRRQGLVRGASRGGLELHFVPLQADVEVGDLVVTAGIDGVYPRGLPIGTVVSVEPGTELFHRIRLTPRVDFGVLDQVYVLDREPVPEEIRKALPDARP